MGRMFGMLGMFMRFQGRIVRHRLNSLYLNNPRSMALPIAS